jgi:hypothetical protein
MQVNMKPMEMFAILASYLILTLPLAGATEVSIYYNNAPSGSPIELDYSDAVKKSVTVKNPGESASVSLSVTNATADMMILEAHVYKCKGSSPTVCISQASPVTYSSGFLADYVWTGVRDTGTGYPQKANIMSFVKVKREGGVSWLGYWDVVTRTSETSFSVDSREIGEIEVHAKAAQFLGPIRHFIENFLMLPANPKWVSKIIFRTATELNELKSSDMPTIEAEVVSGNELTSLGEAYGFIFPKGSVVLGSSTLNLNPDYTCGAYGCEIGLTEGQTNCCYDCGCPTGRYCDAEMVCKLTSDITMSLHGTPDTRVINCNEDHVVYIPVRINNLPSDAFVKSAVQSLGGDVRPVTCTKGSGGMFSCAVNVPAVEECDTGEYWVGPNSLTLVIGYSDGAAKATKSMTVSFPDITIGSFECGNGVCESSLGEGQENCCLDCGCPAGKYCDWGGFGSVPSDAKCRDPIVNSDLYLGSINPSHFSDQPLTGNSPDIVVSIKNSPSNLHIDSLSCEMGCSSSEGVCASTCTLQSCVTDESVPGIYSRNCELNLIVSNYDPLVDYELSPVFTADVRYSNGTEGVIEATLTNTFPIISIGAHWCGDMVCGSDESSYKCCYDCGCPEGQHCDTKTRTGPSSGDGCKNKDFVLELDAPGDALFQDSSIQHYLDIPGKVSEYPSGTELYGDCELQDGEFECSVICSRNPSEGTEYNFTCQMIIPPIDYIGSPYYDPDTREITLTGNSFTIRHVYNEGPDNVTESYNFTAGEIRLNVTSHCGEGGCETNLDESQATCCRDCGCSEYGNDYFCYTGKNPNGVCLPNSSIILEIIGYEPDPVECIIYKEGEECIVTINTLVDALVVNPPAGIDIVESYYSTSSQENDTSITCFETLKEDTYTCPIALENIPDGASVGTENLSLTLKMTIEYVMNDAIVWQSIQDTTSITVNKNYSTSVMSCQKMIASIDDQISRLESSKSSTNTWMIVFLVLAAIFLVIFILTCLEVLAGGCQTIWLTLALTCLTSALSMMNSASSQDDQIAALEAQKQQKIAMCDAQTTAELAMAEGGITEIPPIQT